MTEILVSTVSQTIRSPESELSAVLGAIQECDRAAIHLSGAVQGRGCIVFFSKDDLRIQNASENTKDILGLDQSPLGAKLHHFLSAEFVDQVEDAIKSYPWKTVGRHIPYQTPRQRYDAYLFSSGGLFALEFENATTLEAQFSRGRIDQELEEFADQFRALRTVQEVAYLVCQKVRRITGLDRVMMYQFVKPQWHGEVIAEDRVIDVYSFNGHRFPASDIPQPARDLYLRNKVRWISNIDQPISQIVPPLNAISGKKFDLSDSRLRSVPEVHLHYLRNMGVQSSMSFAVTVRGELWGLVACHHRENICVSQEQRFACEVMVNAFSAQGPLLQELAEEKAHTEFLVRSQKYLQSLAKAPQPLDAIFRRQAEFMDLFDATGFAFVKGERVDVAGLTPLRSDVKMLSRYLITKLDDGNQDVWSSHSLAADLPQAFERLNDPELQKMVSGVIALRSVTFGDGLLLIFRPELVRTIIWGGDPVKQLDRKNFKGPLNPRLSFEAWRETIRHGAKPWSFYHLDGAKTLKEFIFDTLMPRSL
jgi:light-regulated signal transduction histidine kinase (bacteriophytochrome)